MSRITKYSSDAELDAQIASCQLRKNGILFALSTPLSTSEVDLNWSLLLDIFHTVPFLFPLIAAVLILLAHLSA